MCDMNKLIGHGDVHLHFKLLEKIAGATETDYVAPILPIDTTADLTTGFGVQARELYHLSQEFVFLNHGAFGATLRKVLKSSHDFQVYVDQQPLKALDREVIPMLAHVLRECSGFIGCHSKDLAFMENASQGINTILKSLDFKPGDKILTTSYGYGAVQRSIKVICKETGAEEKIVPISLPLEDVQKQFTDALLAALTPDVKLAVLDHIPSNQPLILPIKPIIDVCRERGIPTLIDGAHSLGQIDLNIDDLGADYYVTNCHKWFMNTRGSALMHVREERQALIRPLVVSWGHGKGFMAEFIWSGTQYYSQYISLLTALDFWRRSGPQAIRDYCYNLCKQADLMLRKAWGVERSCPEELMCMMALVQLPDRLNDADWQPDITCSKRDLIQDEIYFKYKIEVPVRSVSGVLYVRISTHIYNIMEEYEKLRDAVLSICDSRDSLQDYIRHFNAV